MDEQRYVVEITRPVPPEKVEQVAQRIAERLNVPQERIVTLLEGRVGDVTKPVLADKADAIAEVFAEAGVRVVVAAARVEPPQYQERFGEPLHHEHEPEPGHSSHAEDNVDPSYPEPDYQEFGSSSYDEPGSFEPEHYAPEPYEPEHRAPEHHEPEPYEPQVYEPQPFEQRQYDPGQDPSDPVYDPNPDQVPDHDPDRSPDENPDYAYGYQAAPDEPRAARPERESDPEDDVPWGRDTSWGFDSEAAQEWSRTPPPEDRGHHEVEPDPAQEFVPRPYVPEEEADRLGPTPRTLRVEYEEPPGTLREEPAPRTRDQGPGIGTGRDHGNSVPPAGYAASTRWTPSPHDPYAFSPEDAPGYEGRRATPIGPARTEPLAPRDHDQHHGGHAVSAGRDGIGGFFSPDEDEPREGPKLRVYLLWALAISLLVLVLLQFVMALRVDGAEAAVLGAYEAGLVAYRKGDFAGARSLWEPVAEAGNPQAQYFLGFMLQNGLGQPWTNAGAANWYRRAANQGLPEAQLALGELYLSGMGVELDPQVGAAWYASAAVGGDAGGQFEYARLLLHGVGVQQDMGAALAWFEAAAAQGHEAAADYVQYARENAGLLDPNAGQ